MFFYCCVVEFVDYNELVSFILFLYFCTSEPFIIVEPNINYMLIKRASFLSLFCATLFSCSSGGGGTEPDVPEPSRPDNPSEEKLPINISTTITRATETTFENGDQVGLFVVNRNTDGTANALKQSGNYVDNMLYTYTATWTPATPIYWYDDNTHADFYLYCPYRKTMTSVSAMPFDINANQSDVAAYKAADLLIGSTQNVAPTKSTVNIVAKHVMSQVEIVLKAGAGFTDASLAASKVAVRLNSLRTSATVDIASAAVTATGSLATVTPYKDGSTYRAIVVPQEVPLTNLITVNVNGRDFNLPKAFTFVSGKRHTFTVTLDKTSSGVNVTIGAWEDDGTDNGGTAS